MNPAEAARALAERAAQIAAKWPSQALYQGIKEAEVARTFALVSIAESLERIAESLESPDPNERST